MNPVTSLEGKNIVRKIKSITPTLSNTDVVICPPFIFIAAYVPRKKVKNLYVGAQSTSTHEGTGPYTGEVSSEMLRDIGVEYVIVGHSEERKRGDSDEVVSQKLKTVLDAGLVAIVCVGEIERDQEGAYLEGLKNQIKNSLANIPKSQAKNIILAYEPVWAIGASEPMNSPQIYETSIFVKKVFADVFTPDVGVNVSVLYGGAVNFANAADIISVGQVDGLLVGRESVNATGFNELIKIVDDTK